MPFSRVFLPDDADRFQPPPAYRALRFFLAVSALRPGRGGIREQPRVDDLPRGTRGRVARREHRNSARPSASNRPLEFLDVVSRGFLEQHSEQLRFGFVARRCGDSQHVPSHRKRRRLRGADGHGVHVPSEMRQRVAHRCEFQGSRRRRLRSGGRMIRRGHFFLREGGVDETDDERIASRLQHRKVGQSCYFAIADDDYVKWKLRV
mmetsp:Transcript_5868/g.12892  ORF Transcript_5868/g.12892 Transcript_5868/m.12892 type:complete len:206 (+) Transcript_5868:782-1399(+)